MPWGAGTSRSRLSQAAIRLGGLVLILAAALAVYSVQREDALRREIASSFDARQSFLNLLIRLEEAETGQRGYLLTGDPEFLQPYVAARTQLVADRPRAAARFQTRFAGSRRFARLDELMTRKLAELEATVGLFEAGRRDEAYALVNTGAGQRDMQEIRRLVSGLDAEEAAQLDANRDARLRIRAVILVTGAGLIALLTVLLAMGFVRERAMRRERAALSDSLDDRAARLAAVFDSASDGIVTINPQGDIDSINPAGARMFGYAPEELLGRPVSILAEVAVQRFEPFHGRLVSGDTALDEGVVREVTARRKGGETFPVDVALRGMPLPDGMHIVAVVRDISERRRAEALKEEFVSTVSHELRTPLTSIAGALGLLRSGAAGVLPDQAARLIQIADANSTRLVRLINNILDIEKLAAGEVRLALQPLSLNELAQRAADAMSGLADERGVAFTVAPSRDHPFVSADPDRVMQILANLLSNAVKASPRDGLITLEVAAGPARARVSVIDRGSGVPEHFRPRLFQKFAQADGSDSKAHGGTGLGLALAREIAERHGGALTYEPTAGGGATFSLDLPLSTEAPAAPATDSASRRLLVCEDDPLTADYLRGELMRLGHEVDVAGGANEARLALRSRRYAALLLDIGLPDVDGLTLVRALRAAPATRDLPIVIISGRIDANHDGRLLDLVDWIDKPVDVHRLREAIQNALNREHAAAPVILHVDDDRDLLEVTRAALGGAGEIVAAESLKAARDVIRARRPDIVILDLGLPDGSGVELIGDLAELGDPPVPVIVYTAQEPTSEVEALAMSVFTKSRVGLQRLADAVNRITGKAREQGA